MIYKNLLSDFKDQLDLLENGQGNVLFKAESGRSLVARYLRRLREEVINKDFASPEDEIEFFKNVKPHFHSKLIYYDKLFDIESKRPRGSLENLIKYYRKQMVRYEGFFTNNLEFYNYYSSGARSRDDKYFLRGQYELGIPVNNYHFITDEEFSTYQDATVSHIMAHEMLILHIQLQLDELKKKLDPPKTNATVNPWSKISWTGTKADLTELLYALHASGHIQSSTMDIKELAEHFEQFFNMDLGNYYRTFIEIQVRKKVRTKFLHRLIELLEKRMDTKDEW